MKSFITKNIDVINRVTVSKVVKLEDKWKIEAVRCFEIVETLSRTFTDVVVRLQEDNSCVYLKGRDVTISKAEKEIHKLFSDLFNEKLRVDPLILKLLICKEASELFKDVLQKDNLQVVWTVDQTETLSYEVAGIKDEKMKVDLQVRELEVKLDIETQKNKKTNDQYLSLVRKCREEEEKFKRIIHEKELLLNESKVEKANFTKQLSETKTDSRTSIVNILTREFLDNEEDRISIRYVLETKFEEAKEDLDKKNISLYKLPDENGEMNYFAKPDSVFRDFKFKIYDTLHGFRYGLKTIKKHYPESYYSTYSSSEINLYRAENIDGIWIVGKKEDVNKICQEIEREISRATMDTRFSTDIRKVLPVSETVNISDDRRKIIQEYVDHLTKNTYCRVTTEENKSTWIRADLDLRTEILCYEWKFPSSNYIQIINAEDGRLLCKESVVFHIQVKDKPSLGDCFYQQESSAVILYIPAWKSDGKEKHTVFSILDTFYKKKPSEKPKSDMPLVLFLSELTKQGWPYVKFLKEFLLAWSRNCVLSPLYILEPNRETFETASDVVHKFAAQTSRQPRIKITVKIGEMAKLKSDAIVNSANENLTLNNGVVSKSILFAAGQQIQDECTEIMRHRRHKQLDSNEVVVSGGHNLNCRYVFHGSLASWEVR
ncbi:unnamed protein product [Mytilus edulis]|uniref:Macro domain-containing protein n=1 Tax=Mytilus edulis TaxID=6550 RepID=A0A8S3T313_MYTED|nr:unnamed protein product [Mytilus edulis]